MRRSKDREEMEQGIDEIGGCQNLLYLCGNGTRHRRNWAVVKTYYFDVNLEICVGQMGRHPL